MKLRPTLTLAIALGTTTLLLGGAWLKLSAWMRQARHRVTQGELPALQDVCRSNSDCPPAHACVMDQTGRVGCRTDECEQNGDCKKGYVCRVAEGIHGEPGVHRCVLSGVRKQGERCVDVPRHVREACETDLLCNLVFCGHRCRLEDPSSCEKGFVCRAGPDGPSCVPSCEKTGCPPGQSCVRHNGPVSVCGVVVGENCQEKPCPPGLECNHWLLSGTDKLPMECAVRCQRGEPRCPEGFMCVRGFCERKCSPANPSVCGPQRRCEMLDLEGTKYGCELWLY